MAGPIDLITANPDTTNPAAFPAQADLAWDQLKIAIPQINSVATAFNLNSVQDTSPSTATLGVGLKTFTVSAGKSWVEGMDLKISSTADPTVNWLNVVVDSYTGTSLSVKVLQYFGTAGASVSGWNITLTAPPQIEYENSKLLVTTGNGLGSTNTRIRRFSVVDTNTASDDITYADSATLGATFTVNRDGWYSLKYRDTRATGPIGGISLNSNQLTTNYISINKLHQLAELKIDEGNNAAGGCETFVFLVVGDIIRAHAGTTGFGTDDGTRFEMRRVSLKGMGGTGGGGGGGGGAPTDAGYIVTALNGTLTNERVLTGTTTITVDNGTANQTQLSRPAITGDVSIPAGSNVSTIQASSVSNNMLEASPGNSVKANTSNVGGAPTDLVLPPSTVLGRDATGNIIPITMGANMSISAGALTSAGGGGGGGAPVGAQYIVAVADATLTAERVATSGTSITVDIGTANQVILKRAALTGDVTAPADSNALTIPNNTVGNAKAADIPANSVKCNNTAALADPVDLAIPASRLFGRTDTGNLAAIPLSSNFAWDAGTLSLSGVALWDGTNFKDLAGNTIAFTNGVYTWAGKPAPGSVPLWTHIMIDPASFGGTYKSTVGPVFVTDGTRWKPANGKQLLCVLSSSVASPAATASGATATAFNITNHFSLPAGYFEYIGGGLEVYAKYRKTGADANASVFSVRIGELNSANNDAIASVTTSALANRDVVINERMRVTTLGGDNVASFVSALIPPNVGTGGAVLTDKSSGTFNTNSLMYVVPTAHCTANAAATHELIELEIWGLA